MPLDNSVLVLLRENRMTTLFQKGPFLLRLVHGPLLFLVKGNSLPHMSSKKSKGV